MNILRNICCLALFIPFFVSCQQVDEKPIPDEVSLEVYNGLENISEIKITASDDTDGSGYFAWASIGYPRGKNDPELLVPGEVYETSILGEAIGELIVSHEVFQKVQEEIARRKSKSPHSVKNASTNKGRFSSKYALTDRLVCGNCGCHYRRVTWNIHGRKQIVWRCISRLEYGKQLCPDSPSIPEPSIQAAIVSALQKIGNELKPEALSSLRHSVSISKQEDEITANAMRRLKEAQEEFSRLLLLYTDDLDNDDDRGSVPMRQIAALNDEILQLKQILQQADAKQVSNRSDALTQEFIQLVSSQVSNRSDALTQEFIQLVSSTDFNATGYSDTLVIRTIEEITVLFHDKIRIRFMGGYTIEEELGM